MRRPPSSPFFPYTTLFRSRFPREASQGMTARSPCATNAPRRPGIPRRSEEHTAEHPSRGLISCSVLFFKDAATPELSVLPLHDALPISVPQGGEPGHDGPLAVRDERAAPARHPE